MAKSHAAQQTSEQGERRGDKSLKKINDTVRGELENFTSGKVRLMFQDEAGFGRINKPKYCWCFPGFRPSVPCHHVREYRYAYGAAEPLSGDSYFMVLPYANTICMNIFLRGLSNEYPNDRIILACDGAAWHTANLLEIPDNIKLIFLPPGTPEMNPIEQIWKELRKRGFKNEAFHTLEKVVDRLCEVIRDLDAADIRSIMGRKWILECF